MPNDSISSIKVGANVHQAILCENDDFGGTCETFTSDDPDLHNNSIGEGTSSVRVQIEDTGNCPISSNEIALFVDPNYGGQCQIKSYGDFINPGAIGLPNDSISSIKIGSSVMAVLCRDDDYQGTCEIFTGDDPDLSNNNVGNEAVSSVWVDGNNPSLKVLLFVDSYYQGSWCGLYGDGASNICNGYNDATSSIRLMPGWSVRVWEHADFGGGSWCFTSSGPDLSNNTFDNGNAMDNQISSFAVYNQSTCPSLLPNTPSNLQVIDTTQSSITISWQDNSNNEDGFNIYLWDGVTFFYFTSVGPNVTAYTHSGLSCDTYSHYEVSAYNGAGESSHTPFVTGLTDPCDTPGPLVHNSYTVDDDMTGDSNGNNNGVINPGETIELYVTLENQGSGAATGVNATLTTSDPYVTFLDSTSSGYPDIPGGGTAQNYNAWNFMVDAGTPNGHIITFCLDPITANNGGPWSDCFDIPVFSTPQPDLEPAQWADWQYPIVPSSITGTVVVNTLYASLPTYFDWGATRVLNLAYI